MCEVAADDMAHLFGRFVDNPIRITALDAATP